MRNTYNIYIYMIYTYDYIYIYIDMIYIYIYIYIHDVYIYIYGASGLMAQAIMAAAREGTPLGRGKAPCVQVQVLSPFST